MKGDFLDRVCIGCSNGKDVPEGEYCGMCDREGTATGLGAAVARARRGHGYIHTKPAQERTADAARYAGGEMNVYEVRHDGHYLGGLSIVVALNEERALSLTKFAIVEHGLSAENIQVIRKLNLETECCFVLDNGDY